MPKVCVFVPPPGEPYADVRLAEALADGLRVRGYEVVEATLPREDRGPLAGWSRSAALDRSRARRHEGADGASATSTAPTGSADRTGSTAPTGSADRTDPANPGSVVGAVRLAGSADAAGLAAPSSGLIPAARRASRRVRADMAAMLSLRARLRDLEAAAVVATPSDLAALSAARWFGRGALNVLVAGSLEAWVARWGLAPARMGLPSARRYLRRFLLGAVDVALTTAGEPALLGEPFAGIRVEQVDAPVAPVFLRPPPNLGAPREPALLHVGDYAPRKRHDLLLAALDRARASVPDARLLCAGSACEDGVSYLDALAGRQGTGVVFFLGPRDRDLAQLYQRARVFVAPDTDPSAGLAALEAMAQGAPVVARRGSAAAARVVDGVSGALADDEQDLPRLAAEVLALPHERWRALQQGARREAERHTPERLAAALEMRVLGRVEDRLHARRRLLAAAEPRAEPPLLHTREVTPRLADLASTAVALL